MFLGAAVPLFWAPWHDNWHFARAQSALEKSDLPEALISLEYYHQRHPQNLWAAQNAANIRILQKEHAAAEKIMRTTLKWADDAALANSLAWLLATCPEDGLRDGRQAVEFAQQACELTNWENVGCLDTLAAAYAESGDFDAALKWSGKAVELSSGSDREVLKKNHQAFQNKQPLRRP